MDNREDKTFLDAVLSNLQISKTRARLDECRDWIVPCKEGKIFAVTPYWYVFYSPESVRKWTNAKKALNFMEVCNDGDDEGMFRCDHPVSKTEAAAVRKLMKVRKSTDPDKVHLPPTKNVPLNVHS